MLSMIFAQVAPGELANGLAANPLAWICAIQFFAIGWLVQRYFSTLDAHAKEIKDLNEKATAALDAARAAQNDATRQDSKEKIELLMRIVPLVDKMVQAVETLGRLMAAPAGK